MSYYRRGYNWEVQHFISAPTLGWNPDTPPHELNEFQAPVLDNFLVRSGKIAVRGAFTNWADLSAVSPLYLAGVQPILSIPNIVISRKTISSTAYVDPWFAPIVRPSTSGAIGTPVTTLQIASGGTTLTTATPGAGLIPGPRGITFEGQRYYISYGTSSAPVLDGGSVYYAQSTSLCTLTGTNTFTELTNAPHGAIDIKGYQSRIWLLGGIDTPGAGTTFNPLSLFFTNPIGVGGGTASADWKDPVSGLTNKIVMDGDYMDPGVGLGLVRNGLVIFRYSSIWLLRGSTTTNYTLVPVSKEIGCIDPRSIVETDHGVYFVSQQGLMVTDGVRVTNVSEQLLTTIQSAISIVHNSIRNSFGGYITCGVASDGSILVSMGIPVVSAGSPTGSLQPVWSALYNPNVRGGAWVRLTSTLWQNDATISVSGNSYPGWVTNTADKRLITVGDKYITQLEALSSAGTGLFSVYNRFPTTAVNDASNSGLMTWTLTGNPAQVSLTGATNSTYLKFTGYSFNIPTGATITGIQMLVSRSSDDPGNMVDSSVKLVKAGTPVGTDHASGTLWPVSFANGVYGNQTDLWGTTWTPADINNAGFGVAIAVVDNGFIGGGTAYVDEAVSLQVWYTYGGSTTASSFVQVPALYDKDAAGNFQPIVPVWRTHMFPMGHGSRKTTQLKRVFMDYTFQGSGILAQAGWTVAALDTQGNNLVSPSQAPIVSATNSGSVSGGISLPFNVLQHFNVDVVAEAADLWMQISWTDQQRSAQPTGLVTEIYSVGAEFQPARDLR